MGGGGYGAANILKKKPAPNHMQKINPFSGLAACALWHEVWSAMLVDENQQASGARTTHHILPMHAPGLLLVLVLVLLVLVLVLVRLRWRLLGAPLGVASLVAPCTLAHALGTKLRDLI